MWLLFMIYCMTLVKYSLDRWEDQYIFSSQSGTKNRSTNLSRLYKVNVWPLSISSLLCKWDPKPLCIRLCYTLSLIRNQLGFIFVMRSNSVIAILNAFWTSYLGFGKSQIQLWKFKCYQHRFSIEICPFARFQEQMIYPIAKAIIESNAV